MSLLLLCLYPHDLSGQEEPDPSTYARRGLVIGGVTGGLAGGLAIGMLADGLCEYDCSNAFREGFVIGLLGGAVVGGLTGMVVGAGFTQGKAVGGEVDQGSWMVGLSGGPRWGGPSKVGGTKGWIGITALRPTTSKVRWGMELAYLGDGTEENALFLPNRAGDTTRVTHRWDREIWNLSLLATRSFFNGGRTSFYLLANAGIYPFLESVESDSEPAPADPSAPYQISESSFSALPGVGIGAGAAWPLGSTVAVALDSRLHLILPVGDGTPLFSVGVSLFLGS